MPEWEQGPCQCTNDSETCLYTWCGPCLAYKEIAENMGWLMCCFTTWGPLGFGCCVLTMLGDQLAQKRGIDDDGIAKSACKSCFDCCFFYSCTVVNDSRLYKKQLASGAPAAQGPQAMERK